MERRLWSQVVAAASGLPANVVAVWWRAARDSTAATARSVGWGGRKASVVLESQRR